MQCTVILKLKEIIFCAFQNWFRAKTKLNVLCFENMRYKIQLIFYLEQFKDLACAVSYEKSDTFLKIEN